MPPKPAKQPPRATRSTIKLTFTVEVAGDKMSGKAKLGVFGTATLTGERVR
ncbi:MAG TPA: hypothetical protein VNO35_31275 [Steroidobacteraceae bacterium]|nr:hypothetical protein [Steroidobacteraceae bacterium]